MCGEDGRGDDAPTVDHPRHGGGRETRHTQLKNPKENESPVGLQDAGGGSVKSSPVGVKVKTNHRVEGNWCPRDCG